jgi:hypothetical protein
VGLRRQPHISKNPDKRARKIVAGEQLGWVPQRKRPVSLVIWPICVEVTGHLAGLLISALSTLFEIRLVSKLKSSLVNQKGALLFSNAPFGKPT